MNARLRIALLLAAALACAAPARAQNTWDGTHVSAQIGLRFQSLKLDPTTEEVGQLSGINIIGQGVVVVSGTTIQAPAVTLKDTGLFAGVEAGWDRQRGPLVFGGAVDWDFGNKTATSNFAATLAPTALTPSTSITTRRDITGTSGGAFRVRAGYVVSDYLVYATTGVALAHVKLNATGTWTDPGGLAGVPPPPGLAAASLGPLGPNVTTIPEISNLKAGWTIGLGVERHVNPRFSAAIEYRFTTYGSTSFETSGAQTSFQGTLTGNTTMAGQSLGFANGSVTPGVSTVKMSDNRVLLRLSWYPFAH